MTHVTTRPVPIAAWIHNQRHSVPAGVRARVPSRPSMRWGLGVVVLTAVLVAGVAQPAVAQPSPTPTVTQHTAGGGGDVNPVCQDDSGTLADMIEGFLQVTTGLGIMGLLVVWQADAVVSLFTVSQEQQRRLKHHRFQALKSAGVLVLLGPLFTLAGASMGLPVAGCVSLIPF